MGIHPWYIRPEFFRDDFDILSGKCSDVRVLAVGECGLDKMRGAAPELQNRVFEKHILLAEKLAKPLIVHCVKAYEETMAFKKKYKPSSAWIIHGFNKAPEMAMQLVNAGFYLSFGAIIKETNAKAAEALKLVPEKMFFLETDDSGCDIAEIYAAASEIRGISGERIAVIIKENFERSFGIKI
jgi:TatD DNase family protein